MSVLEIGTATGYNAALLCHRLGDSRVTTVDLDPEITESARRHLESAGYRPRVVTSDGARGCPEFAPYDRIIVTAALPTIPRAWLEQCATDAMILAPFATGLLALRVADATHATGNFLATPAYFVPLRGGDPAARAEQAATEGVPRHALAEDSFRFLLTLSGGHLTPHDAYTLWQDQGQPARVRYGVTIDGETVRAWLDHPAGPHRWRLR